MQIVQLVGYLIPWTNYMHLYCVSDSGILCNKHNSYWYVEQLVGFLIPWTNYMHLYCVSDSGLLCNKHNSYWYVEQLVGFLIPWTNSMHLYCVSDSGLLCNKHNSYWYEGQHLDRQTQTAQGYGSMEMICPSRRLGNYQFHGSYNDPRAVCLSKCCPSYQ
jgi:hypothetical protein